MILNIIKSRIDEILQLTKKQLFLNKFSPNLGLNFFLVGVGTNLINIDKYFSDFYETKIKKITKSKTNHINDKLNENFSSCLGAFELIKNGWETEAIPEKMNEFIQKKSFLAKIFNFIK